MCIWRMTRRVYACSDKEVWKGRVANDRPAKRKKKKKNIENFCLSNLCHIAFQGFYVIHVTVWKGENIFDGLMQKTFSWIFELHF